MAIFLFGSIAAAKTIAIDKYPLTARDRGVLVHVFDQIRLVDNFVFNGPNFVQPGYDALNMTIKDKAEYPWKIESITLDGQDIRARTSIKTKKDLVFWGNGTVKIQYSPAAPLEEGVHAYIIKGKQGLQTQALVVLAIMWKGQREKSDDQFVTSKGVSRIFRNLEGAQNKVRSFSAKFSNVSDSSLGRQELSGRYEAAGSKRFNLTLADPFRADLPKNAIRNRNEISPYNLIFYLDYGDLWENYQWLIASEDDEKVELYGWHGWLSDRPCFWMMTVDKKRWVPTSVNTFMAGSTVLSQAWAQYARSGSNWAPLSQTSRTCAMNGAGVHSTIDFSDIKVNNLAIPAKGSI